ncbi:IclR family transcriptional regulator [Solwaraspora sp. WMMD1047]|uniref:IclR family transcriptional regulator n=1 Tax=Solwaraspora sp. WMMD1047 TaxID=3016102 RepID=UPI002417777F|nr:IclR family transcriptional regulator [Solwaraspora sp. WMMD1047]MDG4834361.1 IclR family transcriptional regulator [Solwaraspora sp. WMMD1047]
MSPTTALEPDRRTDTDTATATSVGKALAILNVFVGSTHTVLGVSEIARRADVAKSTAHRLLTLLEGHGMVERAGAGWLLGTHLFRLGNTVPLCRPDHLRDQALPIMQDLHLASEGMVNLGVPHDGQVLYVEKLAAREPLDSPAAVGGCQPMYCTALGKAMLAYSPDPLFEEVVTAGLRPRTTETITHPARLAHDLARVRRAGFAVDNQEAKVGLACIAAPVVRNGRVLAALSLSLPARHGVPVALTARVRAAAEALARHITYEDDVRGLEYTGQP